MSAEYTHDQLVQKAKTWLLNAGGCGFALCELATAYSPETPGAIGFRSGDKSILIECKATRSDFLADRKKMFRKIPELGMGAFRFFLAPQGLIQQEELPEKWGLIEVKRTGRAIKTVGPRGNIWDGQSQWAFSYAERNVQAEFGLLASALRRVHLRGDLQKIYELPR